MSKKVYLISLGCARNLVDSEKILGSIEKNGFLISEEADGADVAVVNTCAFIEEATSESIDVILGLIRLKEEGKVGHIVVCGCLPERYGSGADAGLKEVDAFLDIRQRDKVAEVVTRLGAKDGVIDDIGGPVFISGRRHRLTPPHYTYIKISEGCGNKCSYCVINKIKGEHRSRTIESILEEAEGLKSGGALKEINIVGQDTSLYGDDIYGQRRLDELLERLAEGKFAEWIRVLYMHPAHISDSVLDVMARHRAICEYVDLPLQHINDRILSRMNRKTSKRDIVSLIGKIRSRMPAGAIRTSFIVGFPGETDEEFKELLDFVRDMRFERLGLFRYSKEAGTAASRMDGQIPDKVKSDRFDAIMSLQRDIARGVNERFLGKEIEVIVDEKVEGEEGRFIGRTRFDAPEVDGEAHLRSKSARVGDILKAEVTDTYEYDLVAEES